MFSGKVNKFDGQLLVDCLGVTRVEHHDRYLGLQVLCGEIEKNNLCLSKTNYGKKVNG